VETVNVIRRHLLIFTVGEEKTVQSGPNNNDEYDFDPEVGGMVFLLCVVVDTL